MFKERLKITTKKLIQGLGFMTLYLFLVGIIVGTMYLVDKYIPDSIVAKFNDSALSVFLFVIVTIILCSGVVIMYKFIKWLFIEPLLNKYKN